MRVILDKEIPLFPPSVNTYWRANGKTRFITEKGVRFKRDMAYFVPSVMSDKRLKAEVTFHYPTKRKYDLDNFGKGLFDALVCNGLCLDDEQFDHITLIRGEVVKGGMIKIKVSEYESD